MERKDVMATRGEGEEVEMAGEVNGRGTSEGYEVENEVREVGKAGGNHGRKEENLKGDRKANRVL